MRPSSENKGRTTTPTDKESSPGLDAVSWPIILAVIPALGAFVAGNAETWSDFVMILLILYYAYKWITVPWFYYESARSQRLDHIPGESESEEHHALKELRQHELVALFWVISSPLIAGGTLHLSRHFLNDRDRFMTSFNVAVFILAASLKPLSHCLSLLRERTLYLRASVDEVETPMEALERKLEWMEEEIYCLQDALATKDDVGQIAGNLTPTLRHLSKTLKQCERKESEFQTWSEHRLSTMDQKIRELDQLVCYSVDQDASRAQTHGLLFTLCILPLRVTLSVAKHLAQLTPVVNTVLGSPPRSSHLSTSSLPARRRPAAAILTSPHDETDAPDHHQRSS